MDEITLLCCIVRLPEMWSWSLQDPYTAPDVHFSTAMTRAIPLYQVALRAGSAVHFNSVHTGKMWNLSWRTPFSAPTYACIRANSHLLLPDSMAWFHWYDWKYTNIWFARSRWLAEPPTMILALYLPNPHFAPLLLLLHLRVGEALAVSDYYQVIG